MKQVVRKNFVLIGQMIISYVENEKVALVWLKG